MYWLHNNNEFTSEMIHDNLGFVYLITNSVTGRMYIGKKLFWSHKYKITKGKRKKIKIESDWKEYWSSSPVLHRDLEELGKDKFNREILHLCKNKGNINYLEMLEQADRRVLENQEMYYNGIINCKINASHIKEPLRIK
jgi:hypothetical protein